MKKIYFAFCLFLGLNGLMFSQVPTCSLDPVFIASTKIGIWPDSATNFVNGMVGVPYLQNITVKIPKDTMSGGIRICFNRFVLTNPTVTVNYKLPAGLNFGAIPLALQNGTINGAPSFKFPGNANNCAIIYGTPTTAGTYTLSMLVDAYGTPTLGSCSPTPNVAGGAKVSSQTLNYYIIKINPNTLGFKELGQTTFNLQNVPNPFSNKTTIKFYVADEASVKLIIHSMLGNVVYETAIQARQGENEYILNADNWSSGLYFYSIKYKNTTETKRMILTNNR